MAGRSLAAAALGLLLCAPAFAATDVYIKLAGQGGENRLPLGFPAFVAEEPAKADQALAAKKLHDVTRSDLLLSRYFNLIEDGPAFTGANAKDSLGGWKSKSAGWLLAVKASANAGQLTLSAQLLDANSGEVLFERYYKQEERFMRSLAHRLSDDVVRQLTGKNGIARSQIAFSVANDGRKEIWLADYDGADARQLTRHGSISILPRFSPDRKEIAYTTFKDGNPDLFILDLEKGQSRPLSTDQGLNVSGGFSPDGSQLLMTLSRQKSPNIYLKSLADGSVTRLTQHFGADSSPTFSPDAQQVAFVSDRAGNPEIYILDLTTRRAKRLTSLNWCDSPSWSPTGEWIAFSGRANPKDRLDLFLVDITGGQIRQLTHGEGSNENPAWSPDGRFLAFTSTRDGRAQLFVMDADGSAPHKLLDLPGAAGTPDWR